MIKSDKFHIYKLYCDDGYFYIGSTVDRYLSRRYHKHKCDSVRPEYKDNKVYSHIHKLGWSRVKIILIETLDFINHLERRKKENEHIVKYLNDPLCLNTNKAYRTDDELKEYMINHRKKLREKKNAIVKCGCGISHTVGRTQQHLKSVKHKVAISSRSQSLSVSPNPPSASSVPQPIHHNTHPNISPSVQSETH